MRLMLLLLTLAAMLLSSRSSLAHEQEFGDPWPGTGFTGEVLLPEDGRILDFAAKKVALLSWLSPVDITGVSQRANDVWGYVSPSGREYAILGLQRGTAFIEITDPLNPEVIKVVPGAISTWRDMRIYREYAYSVNESGEGIQVIDLRKIDKGKVKLVRTVEDFGLRTVHNIAVNLDSGYAYLAGTNLAGGGLVAVDLSDPANPVVEPSPWPLSYVHDVLVVSYEKGRHEGREIAYAFAGETGLAVIDVTDKANRFTIDVLAYPGLAYCHSGAIDRRRKFLYINDELDELGGLVTSATTHIVKVKDFENPRYIRNFSSGKTTVDHNSMVREDRLFQANYESGLRVFRIKKPKKPREIAFLDTHPDSDETHFNGAWGVFSDFPSGVVIVSDIQRGLFVLLPEERERP